MNSTLNITKQIIVRQDTGNLQHTIKLLSLLEEDYTSLERWKLELAEQDFVWIITAKSLLRFKYHINIIGEAIKYYPGVEEHYIGDIPDFALNRAEIARRLDISKITLHSMNPLPVKRVHIDPVMVGWIQDPGIRTDSEGIFSSLYKDAEAIVIAIWNNEMELEL